MAWLRESRLLTAREAARYLSISLFTLNRIEQAGWILPYRTPGGHRRYSVEMLEDYLETTRRYSRAPEMPSRDPATRVNDIEGLR
jgi:excisionase family DNA binding protein